MSTLRFLDRVANGWQSQHDRLKSTPIPSQPLPQVRLFDAPACTLDFADEFQVIACDASGARTVLGSRLPLVAAKVIQDYLSATGLYQHVDIEPPAGLGSELPAA